VIHRTLHMHWVCTAIVLSAIMPLTSSNQFIMPACEGCNSTRGFTRCASCPQAFRHVRTGLEQQQQQGRGARRQQPQPLWAAVRRQDLLVDAVGGVLLWRVGCPASPHLLAGLNPGTASAVGLLDKPESIWEWGGRHTTTASPESRSQGTFQGGAVTTARCHRRWAAGSGQ
jgi:hypothetical protein